MFTPPKVITLQDLADLYWKSPEFTGLTDATKKIYRGCLRSFLYAYGSYAAIQFDKDCLDLAIDEAAARYTGGRVRQLKAAYRRFAEWGLREHRIPLPPLLRGAGGRPSKAVRPPQAVTEAVVALLDGMPWRELTQQRFLRLHWGALQHETDESAGSVILFPGRKASSWVRLPLDSPAGKALKVLWDYAANGEESPTGPLLPAFPGSDVSLPVVWLRESLSQVRGHAGREVGAAIRNAGEVESNVSPISSGGGVEPIVTSGTKGA